MLADDQKLASENTGLSTSSFEQGSVRELSECHLSRRCCDHSMAILTSDQEAAAG